uniref:Uncharacterized protein n=1 Tax=Wuchereria bancrofti TaxID=6293 RepID=A0AAF5PFU9_WUCBA
MPADPQAFHVPVVEGLLEQIAGSAPIDPYTKNRNVDGHFIDIPHAKTAKEIEATMKLKSVIDAIADKINALFAKKKDHFRCFLKLLVLCYLSCSKCEEENEKFFTSFTFLVHTVVTHHRES